LHGEVAHVLAVLMEPANTWVVTYCHPVARLLLCHLHPGGF